MERPLPTVTECLNLEAAKAALIDYFSEAGDEFTVSDEIVKEAVGDDLEVIARLEAVTLNHPLGAEHTVGIAVVDCLNCQGTGCYPVVGGNTPDWAVKAMPQMLRAMFGAPTSESYTTFGDVEDSREELWETAAAVAQQADAEEVETDG